MGKVGRRRGRTYPLLVHATIPYGYYEVLHRIAMCVKGMKLTTVARMLLWRFLEEVPDEEKIAMVRKYYEAIWGHNPPDKWLRKLCDAHRKRGV